MIESKFRQILDARYALVPDTKGIVMHVESPGLGLSWCGSSGWADRASQRKLLPHDPALIASITKMYLSAAILGLVEKGSIHLNQSVNELLGTARLRQMENNGYNTNGITLAHLNSQTSGIPDYVNTALYQSRTTETPGYVWTRDEQLSLALTQMPDSMPGKSFAYSDTNNLLLTEIIEKLTNLPFYTAMRELLGYAKHELNNTWFNWLEEAPANLAPLVHQFATEYKVDSYGLHPSFDVFGGGGIAATASDVARFTQLLFTGELFDKPETKDLLYTTVKTADNIDNKYFMGVSKTQLGNHTAYGHGGFWGTTAQYFPELNTAVSILLMERNHWPLFFEMAEEVAEVIAKTSI